MKKTILIALICSLAACSSLPPRPKQQYSIGPVDIVMTDAEEIWGRFGCEGRFEVMPNGRFRIWAPNPEYENDRHAWEVLGHEIGHLLDYTGSVKNQDTAGKDLGNRR